MSQRQLTISDDMTVEVFAGEVIRFILQGAGGGGSTCLHRGGDGGDYLDEVIIFTKDERLAVTVGKGGDSGKDGGATMVKTEPWNVQAPLFLCALGGKSNGPPDSHAGRGGGGIAILIWEGTPQ